MGATRKLQGEIDRVLKKVQEGVEVFDGIWNKVYDTESANQKEKFEADLKKEIKKLQRYRDQIKTWIQSSEIKDKKALIDARKLIEREMERFKVCEKETKTKAFSKEGLGQQPKTDPREKAKGETRDWLNNMVSELESQIDSFESEMEGLQVKKGKQRPPRLTHLEESIVRHKAHIIKLEMVLRLLDNDELSPEQVGDIRDLIEDYIMRNQDDFEEFEDVDNLYESLPMEKLEALESMETVPSALPVVVSKEKGAVVPPVPPLAGAVAAASVKPPLPPPLVASPATLDTSEQLRSLQASVTPSATPAVSSSAATDSAEESSAPSAPDSAEEGGVSLPQPTPPPPKTPPPHSRGSLAGPPPGLGISVPPKAATSRTSSGSPAPPLSGGGGGPARAKEEEASPLGSPLAAARGVGNAAMSEVSSGRALGGLSPVSLGRGLPSQPPNLQLAATVGSSSQPLAEPAGRSVQTRMEGGLGSGPAAAVGSTTVGGGGGAPIGASAVGVPSEELSALHIGGGGGGGGTGSSQLGTYSAIRSFVGKAVEGGSSGGSGEVSSVMGVGLGLGLGTEGGALGAAQQRMFNSVGAQWRPGLPSSAVFQNQTEGTTQFHPRSEISPDQKQRYISRFQQVQQQGVSATVMGASGLGVGQMPPHPSVQPSTAAGQQAQQPALLQPPASVPLPQPAVQQGTSGSQAQPQLSVSATLNQQQQQQPAEETSYQLPTAGEGASVLSQADGRKTPPASAGPLQLPPQQPQDVLSPLSAVPLAEVLAEAESGPAEGAISSAVGTGSSFSRSVGGSVNEEEVKHSGGVDGPVQTETLHAGLQMSVPAAAPSEMSLLPVHHSDFPPPMSQTQVSSLANTLGVIGRKSTLDLGAIGDSLNSAAAGGQLAAGGAAPLGYDHTQSLSLLESSFRNIPHPRDSERPKPHHTQRSPVVAPASYPQTPASIIDNPALWERLDMDVLFFAFYYQQGTYQQYLAARELKKQSWRYHKKYNTWFQRHEEPKMTTDEFEQGTYVYFDFHIVHDDYQTGWCQRIKTEFTFEYSYLEDELAV